MQGNTQILLEAGLEQNVLRLGGGGVSSFLFCKFETFSLFPFCPTFGDNMDTGSISRRGDKETEKASFLSQDTSSQVSDKTKSLEDMH